MARFTAMVCAGFLLGCGGAAWAPPAWAGALPRVRVVAGAAVHTGVSAGSPPRAFAGSYRWATVVFTWRFGSGPAPVAPAACGVSGARVALVEVLVARLAAAGARLRAGPQSAIGLARALLEVAQTEAELKALGGESCAPH